MMITGEFAEPVCAAPAIAVGGILIVEDDREISEALAEILGDLGYPVTLAVNGREAIECLRRDPVPCLILLDMMMPVMNGWEFRREQRRDPRLAAIPVVVLSGVDNLPQLASSLGAVAGLGKPIDLPCLLTTIEGHC